MRGTGIDRNQRAGPREQRHQAGNGQIIRGIAYALDLCERRELLVQGYSGPVPKQHDLGAPDIGREEIE